VNEKGVAVIMAMWLLAVLVIIGATFAYMMRLEPIIARTHRDDMKAIYIAQAGIDHAVYVLKQDVGGTVDHLGEAWAQGLTNQTLLDEEGNIVGTYTVSIIDKNSKINLNNINTGHPDGEGYGGQKELLMGLPEIGEARAKYIIDYQKETYGPYESIEEVKCVREIGDATYEAIKDLVTCYSLLSSDTQKTREDRAPVNINTADETILKAVLDPIDYVGTDTWPIEWIVNDIIKYRSGEDPTVESPDYTDGDENPFADRTEFNAFIDAERAADRIRSPTADYAGKRIKENADPAATKYGTTDYDCWTTEFSFKSDGPFTIISTGKYLSPSGQEIVKKIRMVVNREKPTPAVESRIEYYKEEPED
jgi:DNA uptake protein ComE-like DNA-binding protein